jgi:ATP-binding cassette, subfamily B, bacterial
MTTFVPPFDLKNAVSDNRLAGLWQMMTGFRLSYLGATLSLAVSAMSKTATYFLLRYLIDDVLGAGRFGSALAWVALGFVVLALFEGSFTYLSGRLAARTSEGVALRLRDYLFDHIQRLSFSYHDKTPTGELIQRATSDVDAIRRFFAQEAIGFGRILLLFVINFTAILFIHRQLALISIIVIPVVIVMSIFFFRRVTTAYEKFQEQEAVLSTTLQENLSGIRVVRAFARQEFERQKFDRENEEKYRRGRFLILMHSLYWPSSDILVGAQWIGAVLFGALLALNGTITIGDFVAFTGLIIWIIWPMRNLGRLIVQISTALVSYKRVTDVIRHDREPLTLGRYRPAGPLQGDILFDDVSFEYEGGEGTVLKNISFHCPPGGAVALLGGTGSGKSTLVNLLPRFYDYTGGRLLVDGIDLRYYPRDYLRQQIGIVEQEPFLFSRTIRDNLAYGVGRPVSQAEIEEAARAAAVHEVILSFPNGYNTLVGERGVTLSGGQKQRIAIARTLLKDPRILILDDATSSVDTETEAAIREALEKLMHGRTTFIIAHRIQSLMNADLILVLDNGRIIQHGSHEELVEQPGVYRRIYEMQALIEDELEREVAGGE